MATSKLTFILGGTSSGKSDYAERLASAYDVVAYIATAQPVDDELTARIEKHQIRRPQSWQTLEALSRDLADIIGTTEADVILIDSMTLYVAGVIEQVGAPAQHVLSVIKAIEARESDIIIVSDEVGQGVVPSTQAGREFRDLLGWTNQLIASAADDVYLVLAGLPLQIKTDGQLATAELWQIVQAPGAAEGG